MEPTNIGIGLELLQAMKEELHLHPSRTCLDFLLSSCVKAKNPQCVRMVWSEYEKAGLPYNILTYLRFVIVWLFILSICLYHLLCRIELRLSVDWPWLLLFELFYSYDLLLLFFPQQNQFSLLCCMWNFKIFSWSQSNFMVAFANSCMSMFIVLTTNVVYIYSSNKMIFEVWKKGQNN